MRQITLTVILSAVAQPEFPTTPQVRTASTVSAAFLAFALLARGRAADATTLDAPLSETPHRARIR